MSPDALPGNIVEFIFDLGTIELVVAVVPTQDNAYEYTVLTNGIIWTMVVRSRLDGERAVLIPCDVQQ